MPVSTIMFHLQAYVVFQPMMDHFLESFHLFLLAEQTNMSVQVNFTNYQKHYNSVIYESIFKNVLCVLSRINFCTLFVLILHMLSLKIFLYRGLNIEQLKNWGEVHFGAPLGTPNFFSLTLDGWMKREDKMLKNDAYIMSVGQELTEIAQVQNCLIYRSLALVIGQNRSSLGYKISARRSSFKG